MTTDLRVLVVDDHPVNRLVLSEIFTQLGCTVSTAEDGFQALAAASVDVFDLICLDRHMPGLSGDDVVSINSYSPGRPTLATCPEGSTASSTSR